MRKKKGVIITLALAGLISVGGAVGLNASMDRNMEEKQVAYIERRQESSQEINQENVNNTEADYEKDNQSDVDKVETANQTWNEEEGIYLPEGAEIVYDDEFGCGIVWDNYNISYMHYSYENQDDLGLGKIVPIVEAAIKKYSGQELGECEMLIFVEDPNVVVEEQQDIDVQNVNEGAEDEPYLYTEINEADSIINEYEENGTVILETSEGEEVCPDVVVSDDNDSMPEEVRDIYYLDSKCYQVHILTENHRYDLWVDSVTGEVFVFNHEDETLGTFTNGWEMSYEEGVSYELSDEEQKECDDIIKAYVLEELKLGDVEKFYAQDMGVTYTGTSGNNIRAYYNVICKTDDGAVVEVTFDIGDKSVTSFRTSMAYLSE